ncbi:MAG: sodium:solute symporter [Planctomycetales bacterium]
MINIALLAAAEPSAGVGTVFALLLFIGASMWIGSLANKAMQKGSFLKGFFLGNRGLGSWALALTATVQSGGTFMGFPSLVYTHGWIVALWIASYMVVPITGFGILGKRLAQMSRHTGAITVPDLFRARFQSSFLGLAASLFIMFYMSFMMVAQFKAGAIVMKLSWPGTGQLALSEDMTDYHLTEAKLHGMKLPADIQEKLQPLTTQNFPTEKAFTDAAAKQLTPEQWLAHKAVVINSAKPLDWLYYMGLAVFTLTVVGYTMLGGFLAAVWTDLFQSVMMLIGVVILFFLALSQVGGLEHATMEAIHNTGPGYVFGPGYDPPTIPGYDPAHPRQFLPLGSAFSFFALWVFTGIGSPAGMVRIMACKNAGTIRRSIYLLSLYNLCIYIPLIVICICGRAMVPDLGAKSDEIIPRLALMTTSKLPFGSFLGGLILAAPFGAIMATVSSYLVLIASGLVRDVYQRFLRPHAGAAELKWLSHAAMIAIGIIAVLANLQPVQYLQVFVVFSGSGTAATFCVPALMIAYWRRATTAGTFASMLAGAATVLTLYILGFWYPQWFPENARIGAISSFKPLYLLGIDPIVWGLLASLIAGVLVSLITPPPAAETVSKLFDAQPATKVAPQPA